MAHDGTALGAMKEIIGNAGGTSDAQTLVPAIEDLGEVIAAGGGGGGGTIPDGSITTAKLANYAVTSGKIADKAIMKEHLSGLLTNELVTEDQMKDYVSEQTNYILPVAADETTATALSAMGYEDVLMLSPTGMQRFFSNPKIRLCWISGTTLEVAPITFAANLQTQAVTLYAKGHSSTASGILGVDDSWTITANA